MKLMILTEGRGTKDKIDLSEELSSGWYTMIEKKEKNWRKKGKENRKNGWKFQKENSRNKTHRWWRFAIEKVQWFGFLVNYLFNFQSLYSIRFYFSILHYFCSIINYSFSSVPKRLLFCRFFRFLGQDRKTSSASWRYWAKTNYSYNSL